MKYETNSSSNHERVYIKGHISNWLKYEWWSGFEAVLILTGYLSELESWSFSYCNIPEESNFFSNRPMYMIPTINFDIIEISEYSIEFQTIYNRLNTTYRCSRFSKRNYVSNNGLNYLVKPLEFMLWAIENGYDLCQELQEALRIRIVRQRQQIPWRDKIKDIIVAQCHLRKFPSDSIKKIAEGDLMKKYGRKYEYVDQRKKLERDLRGSRVKTKSGENVFQSISQVISRRKGVCVCDFSLLKTLIFTATRLISIEIMGKERIQNMSHEEFMKLMKEDEIIQPYINDVPKIVELFIEDKINFVRFILVESENKLSSQLIKSGLHYKPTESSRGIISSIYKEFFKEKGTHKMLQNVQRPIKCSFCKMCIVEDDCALQNKHIK